MDHVGGTNRGARARRLRVAEWSLDIPWKTMPFSTTSISPQKSLLATLVVGAAVASVLSPSRAEAHIELMEPEARYALAADRSTGIKSCPCGMGGSNRTCNVGADGSDPNRSDHPVEAPAGSKLILRFDEFIGHSGRYRVAFDPDGADVADFNDHILLDEPDPAGNTGNAGDGSIWEFEVQLPDTPCDNCTLQLVQAMHGDTVNEVLDPSPLSSYYTCIDLTLTAPADEGAGGADGMGTAGGADGMGTTGGADGVGTAGMGGDTGLVPAGEAGAGGTANDQSGGGADNAGGMAASDGTSGAGGVTEPVQAPEDIAGAGGGQDVAAAGGATEPAPVAAAAPPDDGGCTLRPGRGRALAWPLALMLGLATLRPRRRRQLRA